MEIISQNYKSVADAKVQIMSECESYTPDADPEVSVVIPCLNEADTLKTCIKKATRAFRSHNIRGEIIVADNGSTDGSKEIALQMGARLVHVQAKGYGNALMGGISQTKANFIIMGDGDDSYDFTALMPFIEKLREGYDLVMGNRFLGGIKPGAMPFLHRYLGNPVLSGIGRRFFHIPIGDFHCGFRAFTKAAYDQMDLQTTGMEFASEMVVKSSLLGLRIAEVPTNLSPDGRSRPPHLRTWRDGWRHLRFMLLYSPRWLFLYPGFMLIALGLLGMLWLWPGPRQVYGISLDIHTYFYASMAVMIGFQAVSFAVFSKIFAISEGLLPEDERLRRLFRFVTLEVALIVGVILIMIGVGGSIYGVRVWKLSSFGPLQPAKTLRTIIPAVLMLVLGCQIILSGFLISVFGLKRKGSKVK
jgi:glycosyltransferase involved in cell wall biosynthesis